MILAICDLGFPGVLDVADISNVVGGRRGSRTVVSFRPRGSQGRRSGNGGNVVRELFEDVVRELFEDVDATVRLGFQDRQRDREASLKIVFLAATGLRPSLVLDPRGSSPDLYYNAGGGGSRVRPVD